MKGRGAIFKRLNDAGTTFEVVGKIYNITSGGVSNESVDQEAFLDDADKRRKREPGIQTIEPFSLEVAYDPRLTGNTNRHHLLIADCKNRYSNFYMLQYNVSESYSPGEIWHAFVDRFGEMTFDPDGQTVRLPITFMPTGHYYIFHALANLFDPGTLPAIDLEND